MRELEENITRLETPDPQAYSNELNQFAQKIDRIMGAAQTLSLEAPGHLGLQRIGQIAALCKTLGYRAMTMNTLTLLPFFAAFWADTVEVLTELVDQSHDAEESTRIANSFSGVVLKRLEWLDSKLQTASSQRLSNDDLKDLLKSLGLG
ncbi:MAG: hypothetical protein RJB38_1948 [Pseudomonadota bacterium]